MANMLTPRGHQVETATSGETALEQLEAASFDLLISDIGMGQGMNGWELVERVRQSREALVVTLGAGSVSQAGDRILKALRGKS